MVRLLVFAGVFSLTCSSLVIGGPKPPVILPEPSPVLDLVGNRTDKNSVGHGKNVALYTGTLSRFFFATHNLGDVFSAVDGSTINWFPDQTIVSPKAHSDDVSDVRQVCVTLDDVVVSRIHLTNTTDRQLSYRFDITGDCRGSSDWRNKPGGMKETRRDRDIVVLLDKNVFPEFLPGGLAMVIGGSVAPAKIDTNVAGAYRIGYEIELPAKTERIIVLACAIDPDVSRAKQNLNRVLSKADPVAENREDWARFYEQDVPSFDCSDHGMNELYAFRWFLLKFSTTGGNLGLFKYPVTLEGRQAFQTYCCYSASFMAFDLNWADDPRVGFGQIATMASVAYEDGRFPWYTSPRTNHVPLDHPSKTGCSLLPWAAWKFFQIHGRRDLLAQDYPAMARNVRWWISDRDPDGNGLFSIDHQLETGMDDLERRWPGGRRPPRYEAVDATTYAYVNLRAVAAMALTLGQSEDAKYFSAYANKTGAALNALCWDGKTARYLDRDPQTGALSDYNAITMFYPLLTDVPGREQLRLISGHLLNENEFWLPHPLPALSKSDPEFDPAKRYWAGPAWPAATCHVIEGFADTARRLDRSLMPKAAELLRRAMANHLTPRADFYEHYDPITGKPLSTFRDYMHSWWIDLFVRHVAGLLPQDDGSLIIDPLPMGLERYALRNVPFRGHRVDVLYNETEGGAGLRVRVDGRVVLADREFVPGTAAKRISEARINRSKGGAWYHDPHEGLARPQAALNQEGTRSSKNASPSEKSPARRARSPSSIF